MSSTEAVTILVPDTGEMVVVVVVVVVVGVVADVHVEGRVGEAVEVVAVEMEMGDEVGFGVVILVFVGLLSVILVTNVLATVVVACKMREEQKD